MFTYMYMHFMHTSLPIFGSGCFLEHEFASLRKKSCRYKWLEILLLIGILSSCQRKNVEGKH